MSITDSLPQGVNSWHVFGLNTDASPHSVLVYAICITTDPSAVIATASHFKGASPKKHRWLCWDATRPVPLRYRTVTLTPLWRFVTVTLAFLMACLRAAGAMPCE